MMIQIVTAGRKDIDDLFKLSDVFTAAKLTQTPLLVFIATEDAVQVRLLDHARDLLSLPDETPVMGQWRGTMRSDYFQFTIGQSRAYVEAALAPLKRATQVVKVVGHRAESSGSASSTSMNGVYAPRKVSSGKRRLNGSHCSFTRKAFPSPSS